METAAPNPETTALLAALSALLPSLERVTEQALDAQRLNRERAHVAGLADPEWIAGRLDNVVVRLDEATSLLRATLRELGAA